MTLDTFHAFDFVVTVRKFVPVCWTGNFGEQQLGTWRQRLWWIGFRVNQRWVTGSAIARAKGTRLNGVSTRRHFATLFGMAGITLWVSREGNANSVLDQSDKRAIKFALGIPWKSNFDTLVLAWMAEGTGYFFIWFVRERVIHMILMLLYIKERVVAFARGKGNQWGVNRVQVLVADGTHPNGTGINGIEFFQMAGQTGTMARKLRSGDIFLALMARFTRNHFTCWVRGTIWFWSSLMAFVSKF